MKKTISHLPLKILFITALATAFLAGCGVKVVDASTKIKDLEFTVVKYENLPKELDEEIQKQKDHAFKMSYRDNNDLYLCVGYGKKDSGGYCIQVLDLYEAKNGIYFSTLLEGTYDKKQDRNVTSYPYIVIKTEYRDLPVIFD